MVFKIVQIYDVIKSDGRQERDGTKPVNIHHIKISHQHDINIESARYPRRAEGLWGHQG